MHEMSVTLGPSAVAVVPVRDVTRLPGNLDSVALWRLIGPTVQRNLSRPLWQQFMAVYLQGIENGAAAMRLSGSDGGSPK